MCKFFKCSNTEIVTVIMQRVIDLNCGLNGLLNPYKCCPGELAAGKDLPSVKCVPQSEKSERGLRFLGEVSRVISRQVKKYLPWTNRNTRAEILK